MGIETQQLYLPFITSGKLQQLGLVFNAGALNVTLGAMFLASLADIYASAMLLLAGAATFGVAFTSRGALALHNVLEFCCTGALLLLLYALFRSRVQPPPAAS